MVGAILKVHWRIGHMEIMSIQHNEIGRRQGFVLGAGKFMNVLSENKSVLTPHCIS